MVVNGQHGSHVAAAVAVVGRRPHSHEVAHWEVVLESFHHELVRAANQVDVVVVIELLEKENLRKEC